MYKGSLPRVIYESSANKEGVELELTVNYALAEDVEKQGRFFDVRAMMVAEHIFQMRGFGPFPHKGFVRMAVKDDERIHSIEYDLDRKYEARLPAGAPLPVLASYTESLPKDILQKGKPFEPVVDWMLKSFAE